MLAFWRDYIDGFGCYVFQQTVLYTCNVTVAHQRHLFTVDSNDAMDDITAVLYPCQYHVAFLYFFRFHQVYAFSAANDKRQHAIAFHRKGDAHTLVDECDGILDYLVVANHYELK